MADEKENKIKLQFASKQKSPTLELNNGDYHRKFDVKDSPFECEAIEEAPMLLRTGHFVAFTEPKTAEADETAVATEATTEATIEAAATARRKGRAGGAPASAE